MINADAELSFHMSAVTEYLFGGLGLMLSLLVVDYAQTFWWRLAGLGLLFGKVAVDVLLVTSKGSLAEAGIALALLIFLKNGSFTKMQLVLLCTCLAASVAIYPFLIAYRSLRLAGGNVQLRDAIGFAGTDMPIDGMKSAPEVVFARIPGADTLIAYVDHRVQPLGFGALDLWFLQRDDIINYISSNVFYVPNRSGDGPILLMPSFLGDFYIVGGDVAVVIGTLLFTFGTLMSWRWLERKQYSAVRVLKVFFIVCLFGALREGGNDYRLSRAVPLFLAAAVLTELIARASFGRDQAGN